MNVTLVAGCQIHYDLSLANGLANNGVCLDFITGTANMKYYYHDNINKIDLRGDQSFNVSIYQKYLRILKYYLKLTVFLIKTNNKIIHFQWFRFPLIEGFVLCLLYKLIGKKIIYTAHNILPHDKETTYYKIVFSIVYKTVDKIIVHTEKVKEELIKDFKIKPEKITVIVHGLNDIVQTKDFIPGRCKKSFGFEDKDKVILFFGSISPYKGIEYLMEAARLLLKQDYKVKLLVAGNIINGQYREKVVRLLSDEILNDNAVYKLEHIPDDIIKELFEASDVIVLPYTRIFQSGVLFLAYTYGCPVIASDTGSFKDDIIEGKTGYIFESQNAQSLSEVIKTFYDTMFKNIDDVREQIKSYANKNYSWDGIAKQTIELYNQISKKEI